MSSVSSFTPPTEEETLPCSQCKRGRVPISHGRKMCVKCRERGRRHYQRRATLDRGEADSAADIVVTSNAKRKILDEDLSDVLRGMKKRYKKSFATPSGAVVQPVNGVEGTTSALPAKHDCTEYQTATDMYKAIKALSKSKQFRFHGSFSIIAKADTDHFTRGRLVIDELRKIAKISFEYDKPISPVTKPSFRVSFKCTCLAAAPKPAKPVAALMTSDVIATSIPGIGTPKHRQGNLTGWAGLTRKVTDPEGGARCKGKVVIIAEPDMSHPLGIVGQKVTVIVEH
ncbi:hypothetical protein D9615_007506 [Tricholomella constricta]|uniref:Uncharacterized protein n=1 Tax=Tricholomella constricta TaxID=117010 RepID=A0A8H5H7C5_9AGAR|nr:hypothetical protein D9615_007506 [Tricholomella constricta]